MSTPDAASIRQGAFRMAGRAGWALTDQGISSFTNFLLGVLIARNTTADQFGAFTLAFSTYLIILNVARASGTQPLVIRFSGVAPQSWRRGTAAATGTMFASGVLGGIVCLGLGVVLGPAVGPTFVALGLMMPILLLQDSWRFAFFAGGRDRAAVLTDGVWAITLVLSLVLIFQVSPGTPQAVLGWGLSAGIAVLVGMWLSRVRPAPLATRSWLHEHRDLVGRYSLEVIIGLTAGQIPIYIVGFTSGLAEAGSLRAAQLLLGPMAVVLQAAHLIAVPEGVRIRRRSARRFPMAIGIFCVGLAGAILAWVVFLMVLPTSVGQALLGDSWTQAQLVLLPLGLALVGQGFSGGALVGLRVLADAVRSLRARSIDVAVGVLLATTGALVAGAIGAAWGFAASGFAGAVIFSVYFIRSERAHRDIPTV